MTLKDEDNISCRICGSNTFNIGVANFGRMYIKCIECGDSLGASAPGWRLWKNVS